MRFISSCAPATRLKSSTGRAGACLSWSSLVWRQPCLALPPSTASRLEGEAEETRLIGGAVRDLALGEPTADFDLATAATTDVVVRRARGAGFKIALTGVSHGTVTIVVDGCPLETTTLREDVETDGRWAKVAFGRDFSAAALRRDFTINALSLSADGTVYDHVGGLGDLRARRVRFI